MGVKDKLKQLGKIRVDFWNEGKPSSVTVDLPAPEKPFVRRRPKVQPVIAQEAKREVLPPPVHQPEEPKRVPLSESEPARRLRRLLDEDEYERMGSILGAPPVTTGGTGPQTWTVTGAEVVPGSRVPGAPPVFFDPPVKVPLVVAPSTHSPRVESTTCPVCGLAVTAWQTYASGVVRCLPCSRQRGLHAV